MADTLALATEALNAEGAAAYFDATPEQLAAFLDANVNLWTVTDTLIVDTPAFQEAFAKHLAVLDWFDDLGLIGANDYEDIEQAIIDEIVGAAPSAELVRREARNETTMRLTFDLGWPKHQYLWVDVVHASYCPHGEAPFAVDDHDFMDEVDG